MNGSARAAEELATLYPRLIAGDLGAIGAFADRATADSPLGGKQQPAEFVAETHAWLERHSAAADGGASVVTQERAIHEFTLRLTFDDASRAVPVMLVADVREDRIRDLRVYHSTWPLTGGHSVRPPLMQYDVTERPPEPVGTYHEALGRGDAAAADGVFEQAGCVREPAGEPYVHCGVERAEWYRGVLAAGPIVLELGTIADDGETVVYEYLATRWGSEALAPQAGAAAYQRGRSGKLVSARIYDDVEPPASVMGG